MSVRSLNGLNSSTTNVYVNTNLTATLPLEENQSSFNNPIIDKVGTPFTVPSKILCM